MWFPNLSLGQGFPEYWIICLSASYTFAPSYPITISNPTYCLPMLLPGEMVPPTAKNLVRAQGYPRLCPPLHVPVSNHESSQVVCTSHFLTLQFHLLRCHYLRSGHHHLISHFNYHDSLLTCFPVYSLALLRSISHTIARMTFISALSLVFGIASRTSQPGLLCPPPGSSLVSSLPILPPNAPTCYITATLPAVCSCSFYSKGSSC